MMPLSSVGGALVQKSLDAVKVLEKEGKSIEIIDLRTLAPLDLKTIIHSVKKTNRVLVAHEAGKTSGFGAEIGAQIMEHCFEWLDAPLSRVGAKDCHIPYCPELENEILPQTEDVLGALQTLLRY